MAILAVARSSKDTMLRTDEVAILNFDRLVVFELENPSPPPSSAKLWEPKFTPSILMNKIAEESQVNPTFLEGPDSLRCHTKSTK